VVAAHVSMCDACRASVEAYDTLGGALLEDQDATAPLGTDALEHVLSMLDSDEEGGARAKPACDALPVPLSSYIGGSLADVKWRSLGMGVKQAILPTSSEATARLLYIPAGTAVPDHGHNGIEVTLVLSGAFQDEGEMFGVGDVEVVYEDLNHQPIADISGACICLAVTDAPLRFRGFLPRLVQPLLNI